MDKGFEGLSDVEKVMRINKHALNSKGQLKSFMEQYGEYAFVREAVVASGGDISKDRSVYDATPFVLALNGSNRAKFEVPEMTNKPLVITNQVLRHIGKKHLDESLVETGLGSIDHLRELIDTLAEKMAQNVLVFQDDKTFDRFVFVLQEQSNNGNPITTIVEIGNNAKGIEVSSIVSNLGRRDLLEKIARSLELNRGLYVNERTGAWLLTLEESPTEDDRAPIPDMAGLTLSAPIPPAAG